MYRYLVLLICFLSPAISYSCEIWGEDGECRCPLSEEEEVSSFNQLLAKARKGDKEAVSQALASGVSPNEANGCEATLLLMASMTGHLKIVRLLVEAGAEANVQNWDETTPLKGAAFSGHVEIVTYLLEVGADPNIALSERWINSDGGSALHSAAWFGHGEIVRVLLDKGANPCLRNLRGATALDVAKRQEGIFRNEKMMQDLEKAELACN